MPPRKSIALNDLTNQQIEEQAKESARGLGRGVCLTCGAGFKKKRRAQAFCKPEHRLSWNQAKRDKLHNLQNGFADEYQYEMDFGDGHR